MSDEPDYKTLFDILIRALASGEYWVTVGILKPDMINMSLVANKGGRVTDNLLHTFAGTPETCVAMIAAVEAEKRLSPLPDAYTR